MGIVEIIFWIVLIDSIGAMWASWCGQKWYVHHLRTFARYFPPAKGWSVLYFALVIIIGFMLGIFS